MVVRILKNLLPSKHDNQNDVTGSVLVKVKAFLFTTKKMLPLLSNARTDAIVSTESWTDIKDHT